MQPPKQVPFMLCTTGGRDRSDSMPSRPRTTSEGGHHPPPLPHPARTIHLVPGHGGPNRPHSMYSRGISYSPPVGSSPVSPASGACSTDSAGSSLSIDEGEGWAEEGVLGLGRYGHSLTPDEPVILEENCDEYVAWTGGQEGEEKLNYLPMDRSTGSLSLPITTTTTMAGSSVGSSGPLRKLSPNLSSSGFKSESPSQGSYMDMYSPYSSSPLDTPGGYMAMSPGGALNDISVRNSPFNHAANSANHSRGSSLAEETSDGYVPMAPNLSDDGYVGMDQVHHGIPGHINHDYHGSEMSPGSSCSITSGTPSTDLRFSEYHLEKVSSYFTPSEEEETSSLDRPIRAYSVGSRPDHMKKVARPEIVNQTDAARVRAFSVGSRSKLSSRLLSHDGHTARQHPGPALTPPTPHHLHSSSGGSKSLSAPLLSHSWSGSSGLRHTPGGSNHSSCEPMDDLMELDFSHHNHHHHRGNTPRTNKQNSSSSIKTPFRSSALPPPGPQGANHDRLSVPHSSAKIPVTAGPYVEMKASLSGDLHATSPPKFRSANVSPKTSLITGPYVEMKPGVGGEPTSSNILPLLTSPQSSSLAESEIKLQNVPISTSSSPPKRNLPGTSLIGDTPYFDTRAKPVCLATSGSSPKSSGVYIETRAGTSPRQNNPAFESFQNLKPANVGPYVEMKPGPGVENGVHHTSFPAVGKVRKPTSPIQEEYMDMTLGRQPLEEENDVNEPMSSRLVSTRTAPVDTPQPKKPPEGYVDMSWGSGSKLISKFGLEGYKPQIGEAEEDYMSVDFQAHGDSGSRRRERRGSRKEKNRHSSQPISIQSSGTLKDSIAKTSSSNSPVFSLSGFMAASGKKLSTGTPPKVPPGFLPLGGASSSPGSSPFSSLRRTRNRVQNSHKNDGENDMKSGIVTPTGSNVAIFPFSLNSPGSPMKSFPGNQETKPSSVSKNDSYKSSRKCAVDATSGTVKISYPYSELRHPEVSPDTSALTSGSSSSSEQPTPVNTKSMNEITKGVDAKDHDYVNYNPNLSSKENLITEKEYPGYTVMKPVPMVSTRKISAPTFGICRPQQGLSSLALSSPSLSAEKSITPPTTRKSSPSALFQPISKLNEQSPPPRVITSSPIINQGAAMFNKQRSVDSDPGSSGRQSTGKKQISEDRKKDGSPAYENLNLLSGGSSGNVSPLVVSSRPPSVSSGNVSPLVVSSRPPSVSSERELHYASLDLAPSGSEGEDGNRSPRGLKSQSSLTESSTSSSSPNPSIHGGTSDTFTYAEINFAKSEGLKNTSRKMRH
uniref:Insulin receptor substrate 1 n=1 Tax=Timema monikensis TaxID=170555 RepID=A0A7R9HT94_9NEOP|nr:unnamed protein product [Timema monikensis]